MPKVDVLSEFGREVRRRRVAMGMTLDDLAAVVGLTLNYIGTIENGKRDPSLSTIQALAKGLGVEPGDLFEGPHGLSAEGMEAACLYDKVQPEVQAALLVLLKTTEEDASQVGCGAKRVQESQREVTARRQYGGSADTRWPHG